MSISALLLRALLILIALASLGYALPSWMQFMLTMAMANGLVSLGIVLLMRGGVVPFGQGLMAALGGYAVALAFQHAGWNDAVGLPLVGGLVAMLALAWEQRSPWSPRLQTKTFQFVLWLIELGLVIYLFKNNNFIESFF